MIEFADREEIGSLAGKVPSSAASSNSLSLSVVSFVGLMQLSQLASLVPCFAGWVILGSIWALPSLYLPISPRTLAS
jgi:hypothetical protein